MNFGSSSSRSSSEPVNVVPKSLRKLRKPFKKGIKKLLRGGKKGRKKASRLLKSIPRFGDSPRDYVAPLSSGEQAALETLQNEQTTGLGLSYLSDVISGKFLPGEEGANPYLEATIEAAQRPTLRGLEETLSRALPGRFTSEAGHLVQPKGSSAFDRAAAIATEGVASTLGDIASQISFGAHESERGRQNEAVALSQGQIQGLTTKLQASALPRLVEDMGIERGLAEYQNRVNQLLQVLSITTSTPLVKTGQKSESRSSGSQFGFNPGTLFTGIG